MTQLNNRDAEDLAVAALDTAYTNGVFVQLSMRDHEDNTLSAYAVATTDPTSAQQLQTFVTRPPDTRSLAQIGYESYAAQTGGKTWNGLDMPTWDALPTHTVDAWQMAALGIYTAVSRRPADE
ncbi:hypothetical protein MF271_18965 (plasmid) [Deinococcus sp. KNUC1210]|uniref:hypothetical protein n=1 Tax=Deinococcus sp. KNUC1210 TaxID=2917691 RepID=UPI001EEFD3F2|nr:hypothetical protein [Deinococcus sp. KNUC1210]ULH17403.1 hypothetical protein MF271_18965 [Deinococcus sp. KNUC1210]